MCRVARLPPRVHLPRGAAHLHARPAALGAPPAGARDGAVDASARAARSGRSRGGAGARPGAGQGRLDPGAGGCGGAGEARGDAAPGRLRASRRALAVPLPQARRGPRLRHRRRAVGHRPRDHRRACHPGRAGRPRGARRRQHRSGVRAEGPGRPAHVPDVHRPARRARPDGDVPGVRPHLRAGAGHRGRGAQAHRAEPSPASSG